MQRIGRSAKNLDFASTGRFGIGMNVMYRYSDCPQLLANGSLHFFDLMREFVARDDGKRGRQFKIEKLEEFFPDSIAPFEGLMDQYPVVFRLPLRTCKSELGERVELSSVQDDLCIADSQAPSMLLFAKWIKQISFQGPCGMIRDHKACIDDEAEERAHQDFFTSLPRKLEEISEGEDKNLCVKKRIISQSVQSGTENVFERSWVIVHTLAPCLEYDKLETVCFWKSFRCLQRTAAQAMSSNSLLRMCQTRYEKALGGALLPLAAAAVPLDNEVTEGRMLGADEWNSLFLVTRVNHWTHKEREVVLFQGNLGLPNPSTATVSLRHNATVIHNCLPACFQV